MMPRVVFCLMGIMGGWAVGCAPAWRGDIAVLQIDPKVADSHSVQRSGAILYVERPAVIDNDADRDFGPVAARFAEELQIRIGEYLCARGLFARCITEPLLEGFRLTGTLVVDNFRPARGGLALLLGGALLPPLLGLIWALPVGLGKCQIYLDAALHSPGGGVVWEGRLSFGSGDGACSGPESVGLALGRSLEAVVENIGFVVARYESEHGTMSGVASARAEEKTAPGAEARRQVLAVFDIEDVARRLKTDERVQLSAFLTAAVAQTGKFSVIPREQLRSRLQEEKQAGYRECFDSACQIELGKAVAAQMTLATQILEVGGECVVTASLYDLLSETSSAAVTVKSGCEAKALIDAVPQVAERIAAQAK